jgi:type II secretory pathway component GspD/PulD (secretin)
MRLFRFIASVSFLIFAVVAAFPQDNTFQQGSGGDAAIIQVKGPLVDAMKGSFTATFQSTPVADIMRIFSAQTGMNMMVSPKITGNVTATFKDAPIRVAFMSILGANNLYFVEDEGIVKILTLPEYKNELVRSFLETRSYDASVIDLKNLPIILKPMITPGVGNFLIDIQSSKVIVTDVKDNFERLDHFFAEISSLPKMVEIDASIVEVSLSDDDEFGIDWNAFNLFNVPINASVNLSPTTSVSGGVSFSIAKNLGNVSVSNILTMVSAHNKINNIDRPKVLAMNRQTATMLIGKRTPYVKSVQAATTTTPEISSIDFIDSGIKLDITPMVSMDGKVRLDVKASSSTYDMLTVAGNQTPELNTTEISCNVACQNNDTVIMGGLIRKDVSKNRTGIPILMDIPVLEYFFSSVGNVVTRTEMVIFLTPHVIESGGNNLGAEKYSKTLWETIGLTNMISNR